MKKIIRTKTTVNAQITALKKSVTALGNARQSTMGIIDSGYSSTGSSGYSKGWSHKSIWTLNAWSSCHDLGLSVSSGNNAPRGGANGEYISLDADRPENALIYAFHALKERAKGIKAARSAKEAALWAEKNAEKERLINADYQALRPFATTYTDRIIASYLITGSAKSLEQEAILKAIMSDAGIARLIEFWQTWKKIAADTKLVRDMEAKAAIIGDGQRYISREVFHTLTGACYTGIDNFLMKKFGRVIDGLSLGETLQIAPENYKRKLIAAL